jgi:hypothetical protein
MRVVVKFFGPSTTSLATVNSDHSCNGLPILILAIVGCCGVVRRLI